MRSLAYPVHRTNASFTGQQRLVSRGQTFARGGGVCEEEEPVVRLDTGFLLTTPESWRDQSRCRTAIMGVA